MVDMKAEEKVVHAGRGGKFPGELSPFCSGTVDGSKYWGPLNSDKHLQKVLMFVNLGLQNKLSGYASGIATSTSRAMAELSTFAEGVVPNLSELLQATADQVKSVKPIRLDHAEHVIATYQYLLGHQANGVTQEQYQSFVGFVVKDWQDQANLYEKTIVENNEYSRYFQYFSRISKNLKHFIGDEMRTSEGEDATIFLSRVSVQNSLNGISELKSQFTNASGVMTTRLARVCYDRVQEMLEDEVSAQFYWPMLGEENSGPREVPFFYNSSVISTQEDQEKVRKAFSEFRQEMWRAAHPVKATLSDIYDLALRDDLAETGAFLKGIGHKIGLLPAPVAK